MITLLPGTTARAVNMRSKSMRRSRKNHGRVHGQGNVGGMVEHGKAAESDLKVLHAKIGQLALEKDFFGKRADPVGAQAGGLMAIGIPTVPRARVRDLRRTRPRG